MSCDVCPQEHHTHNDDCLTDLDFWKASAVDALFYTYFIQATYGGPVKIGYARDPVRRIAELRSGNPHKLVVRHVIPGNFERELHRRFAPYRMNGEWFSHERIVLAFASGVAAETRRCYRWGSSVVIVPEAVMPHDEQSQQVLNHTLNQLHGFPGTPRSWRLGWNPATAVEFDG